MKQHTITTYSFGELSDDAKQKAITDMYYINIEYGWWKSVYADAENIGVKITGFDIERANYCNIEFIDSYGEVAENIKKEHYKNCETFKIAVEYLNEYEKLIEEREGLEEDSDGFQEIEDKIEELDNDFKRFIAGEYLKILKGEYKYLTSEEIIINTIEVNGYEFLENGKLYR